MRKENLRIVWNRSDSGLRDESQVYHLPLGNYPSVTKVLSGQNDFLWVHIAKIRDGVDNLASIAAEGREAEAWVEVDGEWTLASLPASSMLKDGDFVSKFGLRYMKEAADRGTAVHCLFEAWGQGLRADVSEAAELAEWIVLENGLRCNTEEITQYFTPAIKWLDDVQPNFQLQEVVVCNPTLGYAGRTDARVVSIDGKDYIADIKSSDKMKRSWLMQLAAYRACPIGYTIEPQEDGTHKASSQHDLSGMVGMDGLMIMCTPEKCGHRVVPSACLSRYQQAFEHALALHAFNTEPMPDTRAKWCHYQG